MTGKLFAPAEPAAGMKSRLTGKRILITGGAGYLASNVIKLLGKIDCRVTRLERPGARRGSAPSPSMNILTADIREADLWERALDGIDVVFHLAAQTSVYVAWEDPLADLQKNVLPLLRLLETCRRKGWKPMVLFAGSATEIGVAANWPVNETAYEDPVTIYDLHKLSAEKYLKHYIREGIVRGAVLRLANVYGPGPKSSSADRGVLNLMMRKAIKGDPLTIYGDGRYLRDYVFVEDVAEAFLQTAENIENANGGHYIVGSGRGYTLAEAINLVADRVALKVGRRSEVRHIEPPVTLSAIESRNFVADTTRLAQATGWRARVDLTVGIDRTIDFFLSEPKETE
jgi:nucleoside-diphosphate-sugar epimerase